MTYDEIHPAMREAIGAFETLRSLGFKSDDIFFHQNGDEPLPPGWPEPKGMMFVVLKTQGKEFSIRVGVVDASYEQWSKTWQTVATAVTERAIPPDLLDRIVNESFARRSIVRMMLALQKNGIRVPCCSAELS